MKSKDQILKMRAAVLYILHSFPQGVDYIKLFKILYFAQQQHLVNYGRIIVDDTFQARQFGPVSGFIRKGLKLIENSQSLSEDFRIFGEGMCVEITDTCQIIHATMDPDMEGLSGSDVKMLDKYIEAFRDMSSEEVSDLSHQDLAWIRASERAKSDPQLRFMTTLEIAEAGGATPNTLAYIKENLEIDESLN